MFALAACLLCQTPRLTTIVLGGDIMLNGIAVKQKPLAMIGPLMRPASVALANLEIPLTTAGRKTSHKSPAEVAARKQYILKADPAHAPFIAAAGIRMVSLGNNHCMDYRAAGMRQMEGALSKNRILFAGAGENRYLALQPTVYVDRDGTRVALISALAFVGGAALGHCTPAGEDSPGIGTLPFDGRIDKTAKEQLARMFADAKRNCDILIVGLHWGVERQKLPTAYQVQLGRACIDAGADIVWGNHPHVLEGAELYKGKPILYSMGNLISSKGGETGLVKLAYRPGSFLKADFLPLRISAGRVFPEKGAAAASATREFQGLCRLLVKRFPSKRSLALIPYR
ncbi:MAG TPA: CapA family protein [Fimbriimonadaceae bacterium]|nr:CapA family protein [Fimbriimonadaceae bacterium]